MGDLGFAQELGNYGEYSGAPNTAETYAYAKTVLECVTANPDGRGRALLIGGGIANFTGGLANRVLAMYCIQKVRICMSEGELLLLATRELTGPALDATTGLVSSVRVCNS